MTSSNSRVKPLREGRNLSSPSLYNPYVPNTLSQLLHRHREQLESEASTRRNNNAIIGQKRQRAKSAAAAMDAGSSSSIAISSETSLETLLQERLRQSASMGVSRAKDLAREAAEIEYKEKLLLGGGDAKAKMSDRVKRMMAAAADTEGGDSTIAGGAVLPPPPSFDGDEVSTPSPGAHSPTNGGVPLLDTHLEFQRTKQGKHVITTAASSSSNGPKIRLTGKPSSTLLIRNLVLRDTFYGLNNDNGDPAQFAAAFRERIIAEVSAECSKCGHVKDIIVCDMYQQPQPSTDEQPPSAADSTPYPAMPTLASSHPLPPTPTSSSPPLPTNNNHQRDAIVVWVRMDMVTNGFKAAERINGKVFLGDAARLAVVSFYPNTLFDQGTRTTNAAALRLATSSAQSASSSPTASLLPPTFGEAMSTTTTAAAPSHIVEPLETLLPGA